MDCSGRAATPAGIADVFCTEREESGACAEDPAGAISDEVAEAMPAESVRPAAEILAETNCYALFLQSVPKDITINHRLFSA